MNIDRVRLYQRRERRAAAWCVLFALCFLLAALGVIGCAVLKLYWPAMGCAGVVPLTWFLRGHFLTRTVEWCNRKHAEILHLRRENETPPPVPEALRRDLCGDPLAGDFH